MSNFEDFKSSIDDWTDKWEKAKEEGVFKNAPKERVKTAPSSFFGMSDIPQKQSFEPADTQYWNAVNKLSDSSSPVTSSEVLREMFKPATDKEVKDNVSTIAKDPNPIPSWTVGKDNVGVKGEIRPLFTDDDINELADMKMKLQELEEKVLSAYAQGKKSSLEEKITKLKQQIDELSDELNDSSSAAPNGGK